LPGGFALTYAQRRNLALAVLAAFIALICLSGCGTAQRALPPYERPLAKTDFQNVRTTAYTHTEADHREYSNHNALGGELRAAGPPIHRAEAVARVTLAYEVPRAVPVSETASYSPPLQPFSMEETRTVTRTTKRVVKTTRSVKRAVAVSPGCRSLGGGGRSPQIGSAAADWSRWPAGTVFRLLSTGQNYRVEDYGWALSGRNTIDLYMANRSEMNSWGARQETIQVVKWGDPQESLQFLRRHQDYKHIKRMVLELEGREEEAAALR
jgi:3D (Asp-Asp-Asp) domain-containing protein